MSTSEVAPEVHHEIEAVDRAIVELLARRCELASGLPTERRSGAVFPAAFRVQDVVKFYRNSLGPPGELVARAVLNLSRAAQTEHV